MRNLICWLCVVLSLLLSNQLSAVTVTVGTDVLCDYDVTNGATLQQAINGTGVTEVRVVKNTTHSPIIIDKPMILSGGYDDCAHAAAGVISADPNINVVIDGGGLSRPVLVNSQTMSGTVEIHYFDIINGHAGTLVPAAESGGGVFAPSSNQADVVLMNSLVEQNVGFGGGGIYIDGSTHQTSLTLMDTRVQNNMAWNTTAAGGFNGGGGVFVFNSSLLLAGNSSISYNSAVSDNGLSIGGGLFSANSVINLVSGDDLSDNGIIGNSANYRGGGVYLGGSVTLNIYGREVDINGVTYGQDVPFRFLQNDSPNQIGGAIMSVDSAITIEHAEFNQNTSGLGGGAIAALGSEIDINSPTPGDCWRDQGCNYFTENQAPDGGAILANSNSEISIKHTLFHDNAANTATSLSFRSFAVANIESVVFYQEGLSASPFDNDHVILSDISSTELKYVTVVDNEVGVSVFNAINGGVGNRVYNSIVYNSNVGQLGTASGGANNLYDCVVSNQNETGTVPINATDYDNLLADKINLDFRLQANAVAIDLCDGSGNAAPTDVDLQGLDRGYDLPDVPNISGVYDAGANEFNNDLIFKDTFE